MHAALVSGYSASIRTVFLAAVPVGALAFALTWALKEVPLRNTTRAVDPADRLAPTSRPTIRTSDEEMRRAISTLLGRERRREVYGGLVATAGLTLSPRAAWLLLRVGEHRGHSRVELAQHLFITISSLDDRLDELVRAGFVAPLDADQEQPAVLTEPGIDAYARLFAAREARIATELDGWHPEQHASLLALLKDITHELAASGERPGRDLDRVG